MEYQTNQICRCCLAEKELLCEMCGTCPSCNDGISIAGLAAHGMRVLSAPLTEVTHTIHMGIERTNDKLYAHLLWSLTHIIGCIFLIDGTGENMTICQLHRFMPYETLDRESGTEPHPPVDKILKALLLTIEKTMTIIEAIELLGANHGELGENWTKPRGN